MADDVLINKAAAIERAVHRVREVFADDTRNLVSDQTKQDAIITERLEDFISFATLLLRS